MESEFNCQNPNSTNNSIELNLRLDYILTQLSTPPHPPTTTTNSLLLLLTAPASQAGRLYNYTVRVQCSNVERTTLDFKVYLMIWFWFCLRMKNKVGGTIKWISIRPLDNFLMNLTHTKFKITSSGKKRSRSTGPDFVQMLLWPV